MKDLAIWSTLRKIIIALLVIFGSVDLLLAISLLVIAVLPELRVFPRGRAAMHALSMGLIVLAISVNVLLFSFGVLVVVGRKLIAQVRIRLNTGLAHKSAAAWCLTHISLVACCRAVALLSRKRKA